jgi:hypothetical protein
MFQQALLRHGELVLNRSHRNRSTPIIQYCSICLGRGATAHLRRGWRFAVEVVCSIDSICVPLTDIDREFDDAAIARVAFFSGQSEER